MMMAASDEVSVNAVAGVEGVEEDGNSPFVMAAFLPRLVMKTARNCCISYAQGIIYIYIYAARERETPRPQGVDRGEIPLRGGDTGKLSGQYLGLIVMSN
jgi:hypothetical protein